jgi:hypothetical protein
MQVSKLEWQHVVGLVEPGAQVLGMAPAQDNVVAYAVGSYVVLYDVRKKRTLQALRSRTSNQQVSCCCWSPSGKYLAAGERGSPASVLLWDVAAGTCTQEFKGHRSSLLALAITGDGGCMRRLSTSPRASSCPAAATHLREAARNLGLDAAHACRSLHQQASWMYHGQPAILGQS